MTFRVRAHDESRMRTRRSTLDVRIAAECSDELAVIAEHRVTEGASTS